MTSSVENDGLDDAVEGQMRVLLTAAAQAGEAIARQIEQQQRTAAQISDRDAADLSARYDAERAAAAATLEATRRPEWWDRARPEDVARVYQTAVAWRDQGPAFAQAEQDMRQEISRRGVDPHGSRSDLSERDRISELRKAALERSEADHLTAAADQAEAAARDERESDRDHLASSTPSEGAAEVSRDRAAPAYDSAERREATARELAGEGLTERQVETVMRADVSQAEPATSAVAGKGPRKAPKARKTRGQGQSQQRTSLGR